MSRRIVLTATSAFSFLVAVGCPGAAVDSGSLGHASAAPVGTSPAGARHETHSSGSEEHRSSASSHADHGESGHGHGHHGSGGERSGSALRRPGEEVQDFTVTSMVGEAFRLGSLRRTADTAGKIAVLTFWCTTCHSCRDVERDFDAKAKEYEPKGARFLMVDSNCTDTSDRINQFLEANQLGFTVLVDLGGEVARYFGATLTTTTAVVDVDGRLRYYGGFAGAEAAVRNLIAGEPVAVPESAPEG